MSHSASGASPVNDRARSTRCEHDAPLVARVAIEGRSHVPVPDRLFGSFVEHLGRTVYGGIYEPGHPLADEEGFRRDVEDLTRELGVTTVRYPGGNFVSGYRWEDGVGPVEQRPNRLDLAWRRVESNEVGTDEFLAWCERVDVEPMLAVNLGTRGIEAAAQLVEYVNIQRGTALADYRRSNGREQPWGVKLWCLGNEMDGPWQIGHKSAQEYGRLAAEAGRAMRRVDPSIELVACGSSSRRMPTFGEWERVVLEETFDVVDFLSLHAYYELKGDDRTSFLASGEMMHRFIREVVSIADEVALRRGSPKRIHLSFDEWNVWYVEEFDGEESLPLQGEGPLFEDHYSSLDAVVVGDLLIALLRNADRVRAASLAQLVNSLAPIITTPGGGSWRQTTFYPFRDVSTLCRGATVIGTTVDVDQIVTLEYGEVPQVSAVSVETALGKTLTFVTNRGDCPVQIELVGSDSTRRIADQRTLVSDRDGPHHGPDDASFAIPRSVADPDRGTLPAESWSIIEWE